jgi:hypothetical protein
MTTPPSSIQIFHIVHHDKLPSIIKDGVLLSDARIRTRPITGSAIGMGDIKQRRLSQPVSCHPGSYVGEFVPFYFCPRSIMLYLIYMRNHPNLSYRGGQDPIVHLEFDLHGAVKWAAGQKRRWALSTSNAAASYAEFHKDLGALERLDWQAVAAQDWRNPATKEAKQAEFLMHSSVPWALVRRIGVKSQGVYSAVHAIIQAAEHKPQIVIRPDWYY